MPQLEITGLGAYPVREPVSQRPYTILKLTTAGGLAGYGECPGIPAGEAARVLDAIRGEEATRFEVLRHRVTASPGMLAALNMALLDVVGRAAKAPLYQVLGGPTRFKARVLAPLAGATDAELAAAAREARTAGFRAFLVPVPVGAARERRERFVLATRRRLEAVREAGGAGSDVVLDGAASLNAGDASTLAAAFEKFYLMWFDEPCAVSNLAAVRRVATESVTPVGFGRDVREPGVFQDLLREEAIDVLRPDLARHGISGIRRIAALAETYYTVMAPYHDGGPIATAAALHLAACLPNFFIQQIPFPRAAGDRRMRAAIAGPVETVRDGFAELPTGPGLGVTVNEQALEEFKERAA